MVLNERKKKVRFKLTDPGCSRQVCSPAKKTRSKPVESFTDAAKLSYASTKILINLSRKTRNQEKYLSN